MRERLKNRPQDIPEAHFRVLMDYWRLETIQSASMEDKESPTQAEMFIETRQSKKGKQLDQETNNAITKLQDLIENSSVPSTEAFKTVFGKEQPGRVRCYGRTTTPTLLKRNEEIAEIEKRHANEVKHLTDKVHEIEAKHEDMEVKHSKEMVAMEQKFQLLLRTMLNQNDSRVDMESLAALLSPCDANSGLRSSTTTHAPNNPKESLILACSTGLEEAMQGDMQIITSNIYTDLVGHAMSVTLQALNMHQTNICSGILIWMVIMWMKIKCFLRLPPLLLSFPLYNVAKFLFLPSTQHRAQPHQATRVGFALPHSDGEKEEMVSEEEEIGMSPSPHLRMSFLNLAVSFPSSTSAMTEEGKIAPSDPQLKMPNADDFGSDKPLVHAISLMFFSISCFFELVCVLLYAFLFPKLSVVKYYREKVASEGSMTVSADLVAGGMQKHQVQEAPTTWAHGKDSHNSNMQVISTLQLYTLVLIAMYNVWDLIGRYIPLLKPLVLSSRKGLIAAILSGFLLILAFYFTIKYGDQGWMIMLTSFLGLSNGYLTVCVLTAAPKGYKLSPCLSIRVFDLLASRVANSPLPDLLTSQSTDLPTF
ncbi:hypothetical protein ZIOFF_008341 [Zingiber officinale]|uniref:Uncharacterized protein n=1 Tax=Zingiber officinale TaxID=94328 RepID=A0A8J5I3A9_ZINOF|nr:hypothetical protein ZIOFF_008341 [Zingiber officinale]